MTEQQLRQKVADTMSSWLGATRGSSTHLEILRIYNSHTPLARGYKVQTGDAYCATSASAAYIANGLSDYTGTECGCGKWVEIAKAKGIWTESDSYVPGIGDAIMYDWDDSGSGDNQGEPDHVGIVVRSSNGTFDVVEGNGSGGKVVKRTMSVNGKYIRGFITPNFAKAAKDMTGETEPDLEQVIAGLKKQIAKLEAKVQALSADVDALNRATGQMIDHISDIPWQSVQDEMRQVLDWGAIDGGTDASVDPDDIGLPLQLIRVLVGAKRYALMAIGNAAGKPPNSPQKDE